MEEINPEVSATLTETSAPDLADEVIAEARRMFEASTAPDHPEHQAQLRRQLATIARAQARLTVSIPFRFLQ